MTVSAFAYGADAPIVVDGLPWTPCTARPDARVLLLDTYTMPRAERRALAAGAPLAVIHDEGERPARTPARDRVGGAAGRACSLRYAPLRAPYWGLPERAPAPRIERVLVTTGGGALQDAAVELAAGLRDALPDADVALVRGPYARFEPPPGIELVDAPPSLLDAAAGRRPRRHRRRPDGARVGRHRRGDDRAAAGRQPARATPTRWPRRARR